MRIKGQELDIDFIEELEEYTFKKARVRANKLQACSPFRDDNKPSFAVNLDTGTWIDSGADDDYLRKGNFIKLLSLLRDTDYEEVEQYLLDKYSINFKDTSSLDLRLHLNLEVNQNALNNIDDAEFKYSSYLDKVRGIDASIQKLFNTSQEEINGSQAVSFSWYNMQGKLINIKYRDINTKKFWYMEHGESIKNHLFGLDKFLRYRSSELWIVEAEIDAMYLWTLGKRAVALGRGSINEAQIELLKMSGADTIVVATDNDKVGRAVARIIADELNAYFTVKIFRHPDGVKDVNEVHEKDRHLLDICLEEYLIKLDL